jgi:hypothetical protein
MLVGFFSMPTNFLLPNFFDYNKYILNLKNCVQSYNMHLLCYSFKKLKLAKKNHFNFPSETKINKFKVWKYENLMQISFPKF